MNNDVLDKQITKIPAYDVDVTMPATLTLILGGEDIPLLEDLIIALDKKTADIEKIITNIREQAITHCELLGDSQILVDAQYGDYKFLSAFSLVTLDKFVFLTFYYNGCCEANTPFFLHQTFLTSQKKLSAVVLLNAPHLSEVEKVAEEKFPSIGYELPTRPIGSLL